MKVPSFSTWMPHLCGAMCALSLSSAFAQTSGAQKFDPGSFPGFVMDEVVVPVPSEIFTVLDKLGNPNWRDELRKVGPNTSTDRMELALVFGTVIAEGFVAVQAEDRKAVEDVGRVIYDRILAVASGEKSKSEAEGLGDHEFVPWQIGAVM